MMMAQILRPHLRSASVIPNRMKMGPYLGVIRTRMMSTHKSKRNIREYYGLLNLDEGCSADDVGNLFVSLPNNTIQTVALVLLILQRL